MGNFIDLRGKRFGRLTVTGKAGKTSSGNYRWKVLCDCGTRKESVSSHLLRKDDPVRSCGCYRNDRIRESMKASPNEVAFNLLIGSYKKRARIKGLNFNLTNEEFESLTKSNCHYCKQIASQQITNKPKTGLYIYNGIDRVDSRNGYIKENCVPCCKRCNYMKGIMSSDEFIGQIKNIYTNLVNE